MPQDERLKQMIDALIGDNTEEAEVAFHSYLGDKMKEKLGLTPAPEADDSAEE